MHSFDVWHDDSLDPHDNGEKDVVNEDERSCTLTKDSSSLSLLLPVESISTMALFISLSQNAVIRLWW